MSHAAGPPSRPGRKATGLRLARAVVLLACLVLVVAMIAVDLTAQPTAVTAPDRTSLDPATFGIWFCPVTAGEGERGVLSIAAVGDEPSTVVIERYGPRRTADAAVEVAAESQLDVVLEGRAARNPTAVRWEGGPVAVTYRLEGERRAAAPCASGPEPTWYLTGFDTTLGSRSILHLFNPYGIDAVARVSYGTLDGPVELVLTENVTVAAGEVTRLDLNEVQPEQTDLAVTVETLAGRLVAQGEARFAPASQERGPTGRVLLAAVGRASTSSGYGYASFSDTTRSWLSVFNPTRREAAVEVVASSPPAQSPPVGEVSVPSGGTVRIDLTDLSSSESFGVSVISVNDVPVVTSRLTDVRGDGRDVAGSTGAVEPAVRWALPGRPADEAVASRVYLYNPGAEPTLASVETGGEQPAGWNALELPPNGGVELDLAEAGDTAGAPVIEAETPVVAELLSASRSQDSRSVWTLVGVPAEAWVGPLTGLPVQRDPGLDTVPASTATPEAEEP